MVRLLALLGLALTAVLVPAAPASLGATTSDRSAPEAIRVIDPAEYEQRVIRLVNRERRARGLTAVRSTGPCLDGFSERWARHLGDGQVLVHREQRRIVDGCRLAWVGEAAGRGTGLEPEGLVAAWIDSPSHAAVLLKPRADRAGFAMKLGSDGKVYGVLNFGDAP